MRDRRKAVPALLAALAAVAMSSAAPARGDAPIPLTRTGRITDKVDALQGRTAEVRSALALLDDRQHLQLFVVYVSGFSGRSPQDWANATAVKNGLGRSDLLLAVATHDRQYAVSADQDSGLSQPQIDEVGDQAIEPALRSERLGGRGDRRGRRLRRGAQRPPGDRAGHHPRLGRPRPGHQRQHAGRRVDSGVRDRRGRPADRCGRTAGGTPPRRVRRSTSSGRARPSGRAARSSPSPLTPLPELDSQARELLVATDDAVRTSQEDVGFAAAQFGDEAARPFAEAVDYAQGELTAAFRLRQKLDDAYPEDDETRRQMLDEILSRCTQANRRLDAESEAFDRLRAMEANAPQVLAQAEAAARRAAGADRGGRAALAPAGAAVRRLGAGPGRRAIRRRPATGWSSPGPAWTRRGRRSARTTAGPRCSSGPPRAPSTRRRRSPTPSPAGSRSCTRRRRSCARRSPRPRPTSRRPAACSGAARGAAQPRTCAAGSRGPRR